MDIVFTAIYITVLILILCLNYTSLSKKSVYLRQKCDHIWVIKAADYFWHDFILN